MNKFELFACRHFLSSFPEDKSYAEILDLMVEEMNFLEYGKGTVKVWRIYTGMSPITIIEGMEEYRKKLEENFVEKSE